MKKEILRLRSEGKSYREIQKILGCSKGTISYHCGIEQKEKTKNRLKKRRSKIPILQRVDRFIRKKLIDRTKDYKRRGFEAIKSSFTWKDVIEKFGWETTCYLTGRKINLKELDTYHFDHIIPSSKGGESTLDNLGILCKDANIAKGSLILEDFINLCHEILSHQGFEIKK